MPATSLSYIALIIPIVAVLLGAGLGNETFDLVDLAGAGIVLLGIYVSTSRRGGAVARGALGVPLFHPHPPHPPGPETGNATPQRRHARLFFERPPPAVRHPPPS